MYLQYLCLFLLTCTAHADTLPPSPSAPHYRSVDLPIQTIISDYKKNALLDRINLLSDKYDVPFDLAYNIIRCESNFDSMAVNKNKNGTADYSYFQINSIHKQSALAEGYDITDPSDNLEYGFKMLSHQGPNAWYASRRCWNA